jgi:hypothetical protein
MSIVDTTSKAPLIEPLGESNRDAERQEKENELQNELKSLVKEETPNAKLEGALENYLLADPRRQIAQLGGLETLLEDAKKSEQAGLSVVAASKYELIAKIEIYEQNKEQVTKFIGLANKITKDQDRREIHGILLANMDRVMRISSDYYEKLNAAKDEIPVV